MPDPPIETPAAGAGLSSAGYALAGFGTLALAADSPLATAGSRYLNPISRDFQLADDTGQIAQMPPTRQRVLLAMITVRGSSTANPKFGLAMPRKMGNKFIYETQSAVRTALAHLTREGKPDIKIQSIDVTIPRGGRADIVVRYVDLTTGQTDSAKASV